MADAPWWKPAVPRLPRVPRGFPLALGLYLVLGSHGRRVLSRTGRRCISRALRAGSVNVARWTGYVDGLLDAAAVLGDEVNTKFLRWHSPSAAELLVGDLRAARSKDTRSVELTAAEEEVIERYLAYAQTRIDAHATGTGVRPYERAELLRGALYVYLSRTDAASVDYARAFVLETIQAGAGGDATGELVAAMQVAAAVTRADCLLRMVELLDALVMSKNVAVRPWAIAALANVLQTADLVPETTLYADVLQVVGLGSIFVLWHLLLNVLEDELSRVRCAQCIAVIQRVLPELVRDDARLVPLLSTSSHSLTLALLCVLESTHRAGRLPRERQDAVREQLGVLQRELDAGDHEDGTLYHARVLAPFLQLRVLRAFCWLPPPPADEWPVDRDRMLDRVDALQGERFARIAGTAQGQLEAAIGIEYARVLLHYSAADATVVAPVVSAIVGLVGQNRPTLSAVGMRLLGLVPRAVCDGPEADHVVAELQPVYRTLLSRARLPAASERSPENLSVHALRALVHYHRLSAAAAASEQRDEQERLGHPAPATRTASGPPTLQELCETAL